VTAPGTDQELGAALLRAWSYSPCRAASRCRTKLSAAFFVRNLLNKKYYSGGNSIGPTLGLNTSVSGQPRMFGGELRFDF